MSYLTQYIQNISISICHHEYKIFTSLFILSLQSPAHALHLQHISTSVQWPQSGCCVSEHSSRPCSGLLILEFPASRILCPLPGPAKASAEPHAPGVRGTKEQLFEGHVGGTLPDTLGPLSVYWAEHDEGYGRDEKWKEAGHRPEAGSPPTPPCGGHKP